MDSSDPVFMRAYLVSLLGLEQSVSSGSEFVVVDVFTPTYAEPRIPTSHSVPL